MAEGNTGPGRPTKYTPANRKKILDALKNGALRKDAAEAAGVGTSTFSEWLNQFPEFSEAVEAAEAEVANACAARIVQEARDPSGDWKAALEYLKKRRRNDWGESLDLKVKNMTDDELIAVATGGVGGISTAR